MGITTKVALIARNEIVREGLRRILKSARFSVVASGTDPDDLNACDGPDDRPDLVLIDCLPETLALEYCCRLRDALPAARIVLLGDDCSIAATGRALSAGATAYVARGIACDALASALKLAASGETVIPSQTIALLAAAVAHAEPANSPAALVTSNLSEREMDILRCLAAGQPNKLISRQLDLSEATIKALLKSIMRKLSVANRTQAALWAVAHGLSPHSSGRHTSAREVASLRPRPVRNVSPMGPTVWHLKDASGRPAGAASTTAA